MGRQLLSTTIYSYSEYRRRLGRLVELWGHDPMLDTTEAEAPAKVPRPGPGRKAMKTASSLAAAWNGAGVLLTSNSAFAITTAITVRS